MGAQVTITATLTDGTGTTYGTGFLHFQLQNCGGNLPNTSGGKFIVQDSFDLRRSSPGSSITGTVVGNDQILCGNIPIARVEHKAEHNNYRMRESEPDLETPSPTVSP